MKEKAAKEECIFKTLRTINKYLEKDKGALDFIDLSDDNILSLVFKGACLKCKKNNHHMEQAIKEMFDEVFLEKIKQIKYLKSDSDSENKM